MKSSPPPNPKRIAALRAALWVDGGSCLPSREAAKLLATLIVLIHRVDQPEVQTCKQKLEKNKCRAPPRTTPAALPKDT